MKTDCQKVWKSEEANDDEEEQMKDIKAKHRMNQAVGRACGNRQQWKSLQMTESERES